MIDHGRLMLLLHNVRITTWSVSFVINCTCTCEYADLLVLLLTVHSKIYTDYLLIIVLPSIIDVILESAFAFSVFEELRLKQNQLVKDALSTSNTEMPIVARAKS